MVVDIFNLMVPLIPCNENAIEEEASRLIFRKMWFHFKLSKSIISNKHGFGKFIFKSITFHLETSGYMEVINTVVVYFLSGFNKRHPKTWDESIPLYNIVLTTQFIVIVVGHHSRHVCDCGLGLPLKFHFFKIPDIIQQIHRHMEEWLKRTQQR